jgi:tetratricopeptide (TPR) repeat protein
MRLMRRFLVTAWLLLIAASSAGTVAPPVTAALRGQPADPDDLVRRGRTLMTLGKHDEAERLYRQALSISPRSFEASRALGILLDLKGQYPEAQTHLQRAISVAPTATVRHQAMSALALSYAFEGKLAEVERQYQAVRRQQQLDGDATGAAASARAIGRVLLEAGDLVNARKWYELGYREWKPSPSQPASEHMLWELRWRHMQARLASREHRIEDARRLLAEFETIMQRRGKVSDDNDTYRWIAGYVAYYARDYDRAIAELTQGNLMDPFILNLVGMSYEAKGDVANARTYYRRTLESNVHNLQSAIARPHARAKLASGTS